MALAAGLWAGGAHAKTLKIRAPSKTLSMECDAASNFSYHDGPWYAAARALAGDPARFGPAGVVPVTFVHNPPFDTFDPEDLDGADILMVNPVKIPTDRQKFFPFRLYALAGVGFISFQNEALSFLGDKGGCASQTLSSVTGAGTGTPVMSGPFGNVGPSFATGWNCSFTQLDPGVVQLSTISSGPNGLMLDLALSAPGAARAVSFADEELLAGPYQKDGCGVPKLDPASANERLFLNTLAHVAETAHDPIPDAVEGTGDSDGDGRPDFLDGDNDDDDILDLFEAGDNDPATPPLDTDKDGKPDYLDDDSDDDGVSDALESPGDVLDPPVDTDKDGVPDYRDSDSDDDGVADGVDNCRTVKNPSQADTDKDGSGDACDGSTADAGSTPDGASGGALGDGGASPPKGDAGAPGSGGSSGAAPPGGGVEPLDESGCGCRAAPDRLPLSAAVAALAIGAGLALRRARRVRA